MIGYDRANQKDETSLRSDEALRKILTFDWAFCNVAMLKPEKTRLTLRPEVACVLVGGVDLVQDFFFLLWWGW